MSHSLAHAISLITKDFVSTNIPEFRVGDTVKVNVKIVEGTKERIQAFQGLVIKRSKRNQADATFTVRKVSFNIGVERTFPLHSKRITIETVSRAKVRRARLFYLRPLRGKAIRLKSDMKSQVVAGGGQTEAVAVEAAVS